MCLGFFDKDKLLEKAEDADNFRSSGKPIGPLHGIPVALKDIIGTYDMPTECGTKLRKGNSYSQDLRSCESDKELRCNCNGQNCNN